MPFRPEPPFAHGTPSRVGILLTNLGTPDAPTPSAVRRYLREFLSDQRVVEVPKPIWWFILNGIILVTRPGKSARKYASVWTPDGSPLRVNTERQADVLRDRMTTQYGDSIRVVYAMRYGTPSIREGIEQLKRDHCERILVLPMYPQYASSTTASTFDQIGRVAALMRNLPAIRFIRSFHDHPAYIEALAQNIEAHWSRIGRPDFSTDRLLMTFHGVPKFHLDKGDPYHCQCHKTARLLRDRLGLSAEQAITTFQSRFGRAEWLQPYTDATLTQLGKDGIQRVDVVCPGFSADCLETLEEIADEGRESFHHAGGASFNYLPVANASDAFMEAIVQVTNENLAGWLNPLLDHDAAAATLQSQAALALNMGALK